MVGLLERKLLERNILRFADVVLLDGDSTTPDAEDHLEDKIRSRIADTYLKPAEKKVEIGSDTQADRDQIELVSELLDGDYLRFADKKIKLQRDGEPFAAIDRNVREKDVHLFYRFSNPCVDFVQLLCMGDAIKRAGPRSVTLYMPYAVFQRQDKKDDGRVPITARMFFDVIHTAFGGNLKRIVTSDLHAKQAQGYFNGPLDEFTAGPEFAAFLSQELGDDLINSRVLSPDAGGTKRARYMAKVLGLGYDIFDKARIAHGEARTADKLIDIRGKNAIFVDDMIDSAGSLTGSYEDSVIGPVQQLIAAGAKKVYVCATHGIFSTKNGIPALQRLKQSGAHVLITDSKPLNEHSSSRDYDDCLTRISLDYALSRIFECNVTGESVSGFYNSREERLLRKKIEVLQATNGIYDMTG